MAHLHSVYDTDEHFAIDPISRKITYKGPKTPVLVQGDHNSQRFTFEVPRFIDGHDMLESSNIEILFENGANNGTYVAEDVAVSPADDNVVIFSWLISNKATKNAATLKFSVVFSCYTDDTLDYQLGTDTNKGVQVIEKLSGGVIDDENASVLLYSAAEKVLDQNSGNYVGFWYGTQAEYDALSSVSDDICYNIIEE